MTTTKQDPPAPSDPSRLASIVAQLGGEDRILVMRRSAGGGFSGVGTIEAGDVVGGPVELFEYVEDRWGGGKYQLRVQGKNDAGSFEFKPDGSATIQIAGPAKSAHPERSDDEPEGDRLDRIERALERLADRQGGAPFDMNVMLQFGAQLAQTQLPLIQALTDRQNMDARAMLEVFRDGMDLARSESGSSDPYARVGELLSLAIAQRAGGEAGPVVQPQALPAGTAPTPQEPENVDPETFPEHVRQVATQLPELMQAARARVPPAVVAERVFKAAPLEAIRTLADDPVLVDDLVAIHPPLDRYRTWASELIAELGALVDEADDGDGDDGEAAA